MNTKKKILITGGLGFIGSHTIIELLNNNLDVIIIDNLSNSFENVLNNIEKITNKKPIFYNIDLTNKDELKKCIIYENKIDTCIHFAGYKSVKESMNDPYKYYSNNLISTINLIDLLKKINCKKIIFSSSCTVYGNCNGKVTELSNTNPINPYGFTKLTIENLFLSLTSSTEGKQYGWKIVNLRYFNPIGLHKSGLLTENPKGETHLNLVPIIIKVIQKKINYLEIFGNDCNTIDGTPVRDYIHVSDVALAHLQSIFYIDKMDKQFDIFNIGIGRGMSVLEIITIFESFLDIKIPYKICKRRDGDSEICYSDTSKAKEVLHFTPKYTIEKTIEQLIQNINL